MPEALDVTAVCHFTHGMSLSTECWVSCPWWDASCVLAVPCSQCVVAWHGRNLQSSSISVFAISLFYSAELVTENELSQFSSPQRMGKQNYYYYFLTAFGHNGEFIPSPNVVNLQGKL